MKTKKVLVRPPAEINQEYSQICLKAGELQHRIAVSQRDLSKFNARIDELHIEAAAASAKEQDAPALKQEDKKKKK